MFRNIYLQNYKKRVEEKNQLLQGRKLVMILTFKKEFKYEDEI
jgi:hypothetical protein